MIGLPPDGLSDSPSTQTWPLLTATPSSMTEATGDTGVLTTDHRCPFQCSTSGWSGARAPSRWPTAQTLSLVTASTAWRWLPVEPGQALAHRPSPAVPVLREGLEQAAAALAVAHDPLVGGGERRP